jgi:hypothetical protein
MMGRIMTDQSVFRTIKVGNNLRTADDFRTALQQAGCRIGNWANDLMSRPGFTTADQEGDVELTVLTTRQLTGKENGGTTTEIFVGAARIGLEKCQPEDGPQLRQQYLDQPLHEFLMIGMKPIADSGGYPSMFFIARDGDGLWLFTDYVDPDRHWGGGDRWVFRRRPVVL